MSDADRFRQKFIDQPAPGMLPDGKLNVVDGDDDAGLGEDADFKEGDHPRELVLKMLGEDNAPDPKDDPPGPA